MEIRNGTRLVFFDASGDPVDGIVNGEPWVWFDGIDAQARIPVYVPESGKTIDVAGQNVYRVGVAPESLRSA